MSEIDRIDDPGASHQELVMPEEVASALVEDLDLEDQTSAKQQQASTETYRLIRDSATDELVSCATAIEQLWHSLDFDTETAVGAILEELDDQNQVISRLAREWLTPSAQLERRLEGEFRLLLKQLREHGDFEWADGLAYRIEMLRVVEKEEEPENLDPISLGSLRNLLRFLERAPSSLKRPRATLTPDGDLRLYWRENDRYLAVTLLSSGDVVCICFYPKQSYQTSVAKVSELTDVANIVSTLKEQPRTAWIFDVSR